MKLIIASLLYLVGLTAALAEFGTAALVEFGNRAQYPVNRQIVGTYTCKTTHRGTKNIAGEHPFPLTMKTTKTGKIYMDEYKVSFVELAPRVLQWQYYKDGQQPIIVMDKYARGLSYTS